MSDTHPDQARRYESGPPRTARRSHGSSDVLAVRTSARHHFERRDDRCCRGTSKRRVALISHR
ncbi:hypothetical protein BD309DRAFT_990722 [Dichomitus squalens]|uniref:Uncharacterized protein n=1 Tax=Dichomitus squalens TaxID=114155 RepID=A0A4Q9MG58_9APHY|nr:hypothetical protein BD311DRAFT_780753 [Dichomitus squalens]TBU43789.1 hypothetical protein BD309DRAFT_990722 [Dichomitus squalens]TBU57067.1 hypothetical protein BD310DRAFT_949708 [Dichomitus squalens]